MANEISAGAMINIMSRDQSVVNINLYLSE